MVHTKSAEHDPMRRARLLSRILDPEYSGLSPGSLTRGTDSPQPSVFVDRWGNAHDPDFRPFGSYPVQTPADEREHEAWPWDADDDVVPLPLSSSPRRSPTVISHSSSSYGSSLSSGRSRSTSVIASPATSPGISTDKDASSTRPRISPPGKIPRSALFPWTPAQRAVRVQHEVAKRNVLPPSPPPPVEEEPDIPLALVDSRYVPGYGHVLYPPSPSPPAQSKTAHPATSIDNTSSSSQTKKNRARSHTVPVPSYVRADLATEDAEPEADPQSPSCTHSLRQSVYSFGLKTKLGLHHMKARIRKASGAAARPVSL